jgi:hypothetical protein
MSIKQIRLLCLVNATDNVAAQLTVSINGVQKFSGLVNQTTLAPGSIYTTPVDTTQFSIVTLDQMADDMTSPPLQGEQNEYHQYWSTGPYEFSATVTNGDISISLMQANYTGFWPIDINQPWVSGTVSFDDFDAGIYCASQPLWDGTAYPNRFTWPVDPAQGPWQISISNNQTMTCQIGLTKYNTA